MNKLLKKMKDNQGGFTLVELIVVIAIIGILASVLMPKFTGFTDRAKRTEVVSDARRVYTAFEAYKVETGAYPVAADVAAGSDTDFREILPEADYTSADGGTGTIEIGTGDTMFTYEKTVKGVAFTATCANDGEISVEKD